MAISITVFAWTTIIGMYYSCEKSVNYVFGDTEKNKIATKIYMIYYLFPCIFFYNVKAQSLWAMTDILSAIYILITFIFIITKQKEIMRLFNDFCEEHDIMYTPKSCFTYMNTLPDRNEQLSFF